MKTESGLEGHLDVDILEENEGTGPSRALPIASPYRILCVVYWEGREICAMLFPQPQTLDVMISRAVMQRKETPRFQLLVNPQWQPGQIVSDFGFGQLKTLRENYAASFDDVFYMKQISIFGDTVIVLRCYPSQWQVHLVKSSGEIVLIGTTRKKPDYDEILAVLRNSKDSLSRLSWIDRFKRKYMERRRRVPPFSLSVSKTELEEFFDNVDLSVSERLRTLNGDGESMGQSYEDLTSDFDIVTGEAVRDIKLDPVRQFASLLGAQE